jgi:uncharacterized protein
VERAEASLRELGIAGDLRVRHFGELARVELASAELSRWGTGERRAVLEQALIEAGYERVEIDPRGFRSGALNDLASIARARTNLSDAASAPVSGD